MNIFSVGFLPCSGRVIAAVDFIVVTRPGHEYRTPGGARVHRLDTLALSISSSEIRQSLIEGKLPDWSQAKKG